MPTPKIQKMLIGIIAERFDLPYKVVEVIAKSQFKLVKQTMQKGEMESVRIKNIGLFGVTKWRESLYEKHKQKRWEREYERKQEEGPDEIL